MATETLRPNAVGDVTEFSPHPGIGEDNWENADEATKDDDTTYNYRDVAGYGKKDLYGLTNHTCSGSINSVTIYVYAKADDNTSSSGGTLIKVGGSEHTGGNTQLTAFGYAQISKTYETNPTSGEAWTCDDVDSLQAGMFLNTTAGHWARCTQVYVVVDYNIDVTISVPLLTMEAEALTPTPSLGVTISAPLMQILSEFLIPVIYVEEIFMPKSFATLRDEIEAELQDSSNGVWSEAELAIMMEATLKEISGYAPHIMCETFAIESRTGSATATTTRALVDSDESQFLSTDVGKVVHNTTDNTWAVVMAYVSSSQLTLNKDIMASGEDYEIYNEECRTNKQIYIGDITDCVGLNHGVVDVEYPVGTKRQFTVEGDVLTILEENTPDDSADEDADVTVYVWFKKRQRVSQLTDLAGAIDLVAGYSAGDESIHVDNLQSSGTFAEGTLFTIAGLNEVYRATEDATIASNACDISIYPPLEYAISNDDAVSIIGSTLDAQLERILVDLTAARALISKSIYYMNRSNTGGGNVWKYLNDTGREKLTYAYRDLNNLVKRRARILEPRT